MASSQDRDGQVFDYIHRNRRSYSRSHIVDELVKRGHERAAIEAIWTGIEEGEADAARDRARARLHAEEGELRSVTKDWTAPIVVRSYESNEKGDAAFAAEATILARHQYQPSTQSAEGGHLHAGRLLLTGGLSILAGGRGIRSKGRLTVTFQRSAEQATTTTRVAPQEDPIEQIRRLAELRDAGVLTDDEFASKKADLLSRM